jgi:hypothetical protein
MADKHDRWVDSRKWPTYPFGRNPMGKERAGICVKALWYTPGLHSFASYWCRYWGCCPGEIPGLRDSRLK